MDKKRRSHKVFNDSVHGHMEFHPLCVAIIDTPEFQRLRYIKQLGGCYFVYPGACHNRFEHSLGVCFLAGHLVRSLRERQPELDISDEDILCVQIAGLCHDLGHGPFSHIFDNKFMPRIDPDTSWKHEKASIAMFDFLVKNNGLEDSFQKYKINQAEREFIKEMITRSSDNTVFYPPESKKAFLYEIVANERNGMDVDKWDYFQRDSLHLGMKCSFDHMRLINFCRVVKVDVDVDRPWQICVRDKEAFNVSEMFHTRLALHHRAYQHRVVQAVDMMLVDAMEEYNTYLKEHREKGKPLSECIEDMGDYMKLTDYVFHEILLNPGVDAHLQKAQGILQNLQKRKLYKCLGKSKPFTATSASDVFKMKQTDIENELVKLMKTETLDRSIFAIQIVRLDLGRKEKNPLDNLRFYSKKDMNKAVPLDASEISHMIPKVYQEHKVLLFFRSADNEAEEQLLRDAFAEWCKTRINSGHQKLELVLDQPKQALKTRQTSDRPGTSSDHSPRKKGKLE
ncbi:hypothetical protein ACOMHN_004445 [Nucella lapillus]